MPEMSVVIYEVNLSIDAAIIDDYRAWLAAHVTQMLDVPGFIDAEVFDLLDPPAAAGEIALSVRYRVHGMAALQDYFDHRAAAMREDGQHRFAGRFRATRRVLALSAHA